MIFKFRPLLKPTLWGSDRIAAMKRLGEVPGIGESWEVSGIEGSVSVVAEGDYAGQTLALLVRCLGPRLVGEHVAALYGEEFPLLVKIIDAHADLSVQVHPDDEAARRHGHARGKTEMWYIMPSDVDAKLYCGFNHDMTVEEYHRRVHDGTLCEALRQYAVREGDVFYLPSGRVHAICAGCLLIEVQQASDVTFRMYDYGRKDRDGRERPLHIDEAAEVTLWGDNGDERICYTPEVGHGVELVRCTAFCVVRYDIEDEAIPIREAAADSFVILIGIAGEGTVEAAGRKTPLCCNETLLVAAECTDLRVKGRMSLLVVYVP